MTRTRRGIAAAGLAIMAAAVVAAWWAERPVRRDDEAPHPGATPAAASVREPPPVDGAAARPLGDPPSVEDGADRARDHGTRGEGDAPGGEGRGPAPVAAVVAGCGDDEDVRRPSPADPLRWRLAELVDRANAALAAARAGDADPAFLRTLLAALGAGDAPPDPAALADLEAAPGRRTGDGFDLAAAAWLRHAARAHRAGDDDAVVRRATRADALAPGDPLPPLLQALAHERAGRPAEARGAFVEAFRRDPSEPGPALAAGRRLATTARFDEARAALEAYLEAHPEDRGMRGLAARLEVRAHAFAGARVRALDGLTLVVAPGALAASRDRRLHLALARALADAAWLTGTERRAELTVLVHRDREALRRATCGASWTDALYDGALHLHGEALADDDRGRRTLRHEALHAQLHSVPVRWPRWFDEGVAQHFAGEAGPAARASFRVMVDNDTWVPFASLEGSFLVIAHHGDAGLAYHQSRAMVDWLVARRGRGVIAEGVAWLLAGGDPAGLAARLGGTGFDGRTLVDWLARRAG